jgi:hypothetical protein
MTKDNARSHLWNVNCTSVTENKRIFYILVITQIVINDQDKFKPNTAVVRIVNIVTILVDRTNQNIDGKRGILTHRC